MGSFNGAKFIREQLATLAAQSYPLHELVITDDGSTDETPIIVAEFAAIAPFPVHFYRNSKRLGYADNFLYAASLCTGDLIGFCDQDDLWMPEKVELCRHEFYDPEVLLVVHSAELFGEGIPNGQRVPDYPRRKVFPPLNYYPLVSSFGFAMVFRRELLEITDNKNRPLTKPEGGSVLAHDQWLWLLGTCFGKTITLPYVLAYYRQHGSNTFGAEINPSGNGIANALTRYDYSMRADEENRAATFLEEIEKVSAERWRDRAGRAGRFLRKCAAINLIRSKIYLPESSISRRLATFSSLVLGGGYSLGNTAAWLGWRAMLKDLIVGVMHLR
jgi:glycosyltransferase involved in cell wall biosynthesis